ncbi:MAG: hypothetical protein H6742_09460 [Alphaproteobacteria bacterium]|nr:hypothetical protein [Alphaproteobacteria bacterium]
MGPERGNIEFLADLWRAGRTGVLRRADEVPLEGPPVAVADGGLVEPWQVVDLAEHISGGPLTLDEAPAEGPGDRGAMLRFLLAACGSHLDPYRNLLPVGSLRLSCGPDDQAYISASLRAALVDGPRAAELLSSGRATRRQLVALCFLGLVDAEGGVELGTDPEAPPRITLPAGESETEEIRPGAPGTSLDEAFAEAVHEDPTDLSRTSGDEESDRLDVEPAVCFVGGVDWGPSASRMKLDALLEGAPGADGGATAAEPEPEPVAVLVEELTEEVGEPSAEAAPVTPVRQKVAEQETDGVVLRADAVAPPESTSGGLFEAPEELVWPDEEETGPAPEVEPGLIDDDRAYFLGGGDVEHVLFDDFDALGLPDAPQADEVEYFLTGPDDAEESSYSLPAPPLVEEDDDEGALAVEVHFRWGPPVDADVEVIDEEEGADDSAATLTWADEMLGVEDEDPSAPAWRSPAEGETGGAVRIGGREWSFPDARARAQPTDGYDGERQELLLLQAELDALITGASPPARAPEPVVEDLLDAPTGPAPARRDDSDAEVLSGSADELGMLEHLFSGGDDDAQASLPAWSQAPTFDPSVEPEVLDIYDRLLARAWECICADDLREARDVLERATILVEDNPRASLLHAWVVLRLEPRATDVARDALDHAGPEHRDDPVVDGLVTRLQTLMAAGTR